MRYLFIIIAFIASCTSKPGQNEALVSIAARSELTGNITNVDRVGDLIYDVQVQSDGRLYTHRCLMDSSLSDVKKRILVEFCMPVGEDMVCEDQPIGNVAWAVK